jgi:hypothetical protein
MTVIKPIESTTNNRPICVAIAVRLLADVTHVSPVFIEQIVPLVLRSLVRLRMVPVFVRQLMVAEARQLICKYRASPPNEVLHGCQVRSRALPTEFK